MTIVCPATEGSQISHTFQDFGKDRQLAADQTPWNSNYCQMSSQSISVDTMKMAVLKFCSDFVNAISNGKLAWLSVPHCSIRHCQSQYPAVVSRDYIQLSWHASPVAWLLPQRTNSISRLRKWSVYRSSGSRLWYTPGLCAWSTAFSAVHCRNWQSHQATWPWSSYLGWLQPAIFIVQFISVGLSNQRW